MSSGFLFLIVVSGVVACTEFPIEFEAEVGSSFAADEYDLVSF